MARKTTTTAKPRAKAKATPAASKNGAATLVAVPAPVAIASAPAPAPVSAELQGLRLEWRPETDGSAQLVVAYEGQLAPRDEVVARAGTWRQGSAPWTETRDLPLKRVGNGWVGAIPVAAGAPVEAVELVFRAGDEWDNGGRAPLGYYEWAPRESRIEVR